MNENTKVTHIYEKKFKSCSVLILINNTSMTKNDQHFEFLH
jgi:hypothetical protein